MDEKAYLAKVHLGLDRAYRLAGLLLGNAAEAEDVTHDAVIRGWKAAPGLRDPTRFEAWFDRIVINACRDRLRRQRRIQFVSIDDIDTVGASRDPFAAVLAADAVYAALQSLELDLRAVVVLRFWGDMTIDQIADRLDVPSGTVKSRLSRALERLRQATALSAEAEVTT